MKSSLLTGLMAFTVLGVIIMGFANIAAIGYLLYLWGSVGLAFSAAAWSAFVLWFKVLGTGLFMYIAGAISVYYLD